MSNEKKISSHYSITTLTMERDRFEDGYREFLRVPSLNCGIYRLAAGSNDPQGPHEEDEVYYVMKGKGRLQVEHPGETKHLRAEAGDALFVARDTRHHFHSIVVDLELLVFFSNAV